MKRLLCVAFAALAALSLVTCGAQAEILFYDNFDTSTDIDSLNAELGRQTGTLAQIQYAELEARAWRVYNNGPALKEPVPGGMSMGTKFEPAPGGENAGAQLLYNFEDYNSFAISVDVDPIKEEKSTIPVGYDATQDWSAVTFGHGYDSYWSTGQGFVFKLYHGGAWQAYWALDEQNGGSGAVASKPGFYNLRFEVRQAGNSDPASVAILVDGVNIWNYTIAGGIQNNKIYMLAHTDQSFGVDGIEFHGWDNLMVETIPVPEPGSIMALGAGLAGLAGFAIRRRK